MIPDCRNGREAAADHPAADRSRPEEADRGRDPRRSAGPRRHGRDARRRQAAADTVIGERPEQQLGALGGGLGGGAGGSAQTSALALGGAPQKGAAGARRACPAESCRAARAGGAGRAATPGRRCRRWRALGAAGPAPRRPERRAPSGSARRCSSSTPITRRLARDCPWDREQDERSIVPHTVEEAYELADAAHSGRRRQAARRARRRALPGLLPRRCCSRSAARATSPTVARGTAEKLVRRHPHVFGEEPPSWRTFRPRRGPPSEVRENWDAIKRTEPGAAEPFGSIPENLPALLYARKLQRRAARRRDRGEPAGTRCRRRPRRSARRSARSAAKAPDRGTARGFYERDRRAAASPAWSSRAPSGVDPGDRAPPARRAVPRPCRGAPRDERDPRRPRAPDPRLARQPDGRGRRLAAVGQPRPRGRSVGRLDRRVRGGRAARRRRGLGRQGRRAGGRATSTARSRKAIIGVDADDQDGARPPADRARRHAQQGAPRRQRDPGRLARGREGAPRTRRACRSTATSAASRRTCCRCR